MKKSHIFALLSIAVLLSIIIGALYETDTYGNFKKAKENPDAVFQIIGKLDKSIPVVFDSLSIDQQLIFSMIDEENDTENVVYYGDKPRDFEKLEQVVVTGSMKVNFFEAKELLLKCPSKYTKKPVDDQKYSSSNK